jgi:hypothetical protein
MTENNGTFFKARCEEKRMIVVAFVRTRTPVAAAMISSLAQKLG